MRKTIYDRDVWNFLLVKYPDLRRKVNSLGLQNHPEKAKILRNSLMHSNHSDRRLTEDESSLAIELAAIEFAEQRFLSMAVSRAEEAIKVGDSEYTGAVISLIKMDFNESFKDFLKLCEYYNENINNISFKRAYELFLKAIALKLKYKNQYTVLFIKKFIELRGKQYSNEVREYFMESDPEVYLKISNELLLTNSD